VGIVAFLSVSNLLQYPRINAHSLALGTRSK
jgi:hypothetical protein